MEDDLEGTKWKHRFTGEIFECGRHTKSGQLILFSIRYNRAISRSLWYLKLLYKPISW